MFNLHRKYLFSKINIIIVMVMLFIISLILFISIKPNYSLEVRWLNREACTSNYLQNMIFSIKFVGIVLSCYIMGSSFSVNIDGYSVLFLRSRAGKIKYFFGKLFTLILFTIVIVLILMLVGTFILYSIGSWYNDWVILIKIAMKLTTIILIYGLISVVFTISFKSYFSFLLPIVLFIGMEICSDIVCGTKIYSILTLFFPFFDFSNLTENLIVDLLMICSYSLIGGIVYYHQNI